MRAVGQQRNPYGLPLLGKDGQKGGFRMAGSTKPTQDEILALEKSYWDAVKAKDGRRTADLSGDSSIVANTRGVMSIPRERMGAMTESGDWSLESYDMADIEFSAPTSDVAVIAYTVRQKLTMQGQPQEFRAADISTWVRGSDGWKCHAHSETFLADSP